MKRPRKPKRQPSRLSPKQVARAADEALDGLSLTQTPSPVVSERKRMLIVHRVLQRAAENSKRRDRYFDSKLDLMQVTMAVRRLTGRPTLPIAVLADLHALVTLGTVRKIIPDDEYQGDNDSWWTVADGEPPRLGEGDGPDLVTADD